MGEKKIVGILDNLEAFMEFEEGNPKKTESAWDQEFSFESKPIVETDAMGREKFWEDLGRPDNTGLALKTFKEQCCDQCDC